MTSFNILGVCTSRDIFSRTKDGANYQINKYTLGFSPFFCFEPGLKFDKDEFYKVEYKNGTNFSKRAAYIEFTRSVFDFLTEQESDYLLIDVAMLRSSYFKTEDGNYFVCSTKKRMDFYQNLVKDLNFPAVKEQNIPCDFLPEDEIRKRLKAYAAKLLTIYKPAQIILCNHQLSRMLYKNRRIVFFSNFDENWGHKNEFISFCFNIMKTELKGCHIIESLSNAVADVKHPLGIHPMHFTPGYYKYCIESINLITKGLPVDEESMRLKNIHDKWNKFYATKYFKKLLDYTAVLKADNESFNKNREDQIIKGNNAVNVNSVADDAIIDDI